MMKTRSRILKLVSIFVLSLVGFTANAQICTLTLLNTTAGACNDNGTPFDQTDDTFPATVNISAMNSPTGQFTASDGTNTFGPFDYNVDVVVDVPSDGNIYTLTFTDTGFSTCSVTTTVSQEPCCQIDVTETTFPETFIGANNGEIQLCINSGTEPFNIEVSPLTTASIYENPGSCLYNYIVSGLPQGTYTVNITDADGCETTLTDIDIDGPNCTGFMLAEIGGGSTSCIGTNDGTMEISLYDPGDATSITVDVGQGIPPMTFTALEGPLTFTDLPAGSYDVALFDNNGCEVTYIYNPVQVTEPEAISMESSSTDVTTIGGTDGSTQVCVGGANGGFIVTTNPEVGTITANDNQCPGQQGFLVTDMPAGSYEIIATDGNGCADTTYVIINDPSCPLQIDNIQNTDIICGGTNTGVSDIDVSGGTAPYSISLDGGQTFSAPQANSNFLLDTLLAGTYDIIIADANGCSVSVGTHTVITEISPIVMEDPYTSHVSNLGFSNGSAEICINGGTPNYTLTVSPNTGTLTNTGPSGVCEATYLLDDLVAGIYEITVEDDLGCIEVFEVEILEPSCPDFTIDDVLVDSVSCYGANDGSLTISLDGGTAPFTYEVSGVQTVMTNDNPYTFNGLDDGGYGVFVYESGGCFAPYSIELPITEPQPLRSVITIVPPCEGESNGVLCFVPEGGSEEGYSYTVLDEDDNEVTVIEGTHSECVGDFYVEGIEAGNYHVELVDGMGCVAHTVTTVSEVSIGIAPLITPDCSGVDGGAIDISYGGGTAPYTFSWSTGETTEDIANLSDGNYGVTVTDARGCAGVADIVVDLLDLELNFNEAATCEEQNAGAIITVVNNGTSNYDLMWSGEGNSGDILGNTNNIITLSDLDAGDYDITVTDGRGCTAASNTTVTEYDIVAEMVVLNTCVGESNGFVGGTPSAGIPDFTYNWSTGDVSGVLTDLDVGTYTVTITDLNGCTATGEGTVDEYELVPTFEVMNVCTGENSGSILVNVENAEGALSYNWSNGAVTNPLLGVAQGTYDVTITDAAGCSVTATTNVNEFDAPTATTSGDAIIEQGESAPIAVNANGGTAPYTYQWFPSDVTNPTSASTNVSPFVTTTYTAVITDANGCTAFDTILVTVVPDVLVVMPTAFSPNGDTNNEIYEPFIPNADAEIITFQIFDRWGQLLHNDPTASWDGRYKEKDQPVGTYVYVVEFLDLLNRKELLKGHFNLIR